MLNWNAQTADAKGLGLRSVDRNISGEIVGGRTHDGQTVASPDGKSMTGPSHGSMGWLDQMREAQKTRGQGYGVTRGGQTEVPRAPAGAPVVNPGPPRTVVTRAPAQNGNPLLAPRSLEYTGVPPNVRTADGNAIGAKPYIAPNAFNGLRIKPDDAISNSNEREYAGVGQGNPQNANPLLVRTGRELGGGYRQDPVATISGQVGGGTAHNVGNGLKTIAGAYGGGYSRPDDGKPMAGAGIYDEKGLVKASRGAAPATGNPLVNPFPDLTAKVGSALKSLVTGGTAAAVGTEAGNWVRQGLDAMHRGLRSPNPLVGPSETHPSEQTLLGHSAEVPDVDAALTPARHPNPAPEIMRPTLKAGGGLPDSEELRRRRAQQPANPLVNPLN